MCFFLVLFSQLRAQIIALVFLFYFCKNNKAITSFKPDSEQKSTAFSLPTFSFPNLRYLSFLTMKLFCNLKLLVMVNYYEKGVATLPVFTMPMPVWTTRCEYNSKSCGPDRYWHCDKAKNFGILDLSCVKKCKSLILQGSATWQDFKYKLYYKKLIWMVSILYVQSCVYWSSCCYKIKLNIFQSLLQFRHKQWTLARDAI